VVSDTDPIRQLAETIAAALFVDGFGNKAERLQFMGAEDKPMGTGWGVQGAANQIEAILRREGMPANAPDPQPSPARVEDEIRRPEASMARMNEAEPDEIESEEYEMVLNRLVKLREIRDAAPAFAVGDVVMDGKGVVSQIVAAEFMSRLPNGNIYSPTNIRHANPIARAAFEAEEAGRKEQSK
jgi:hypothetical protein